MSAKSVQLMLTLMLQVYRKHNSVSKHASTLELLKLL